MWYDSNLFFLFPTVNTQGRYFLFSFSTSQLNSLEVFGSECLLLTLTVWWVYHGQKHFRERFPHYANSFNAFSRANISFVSLMKWKGCYFSFLFHCISLHRATISYEIKDHLHTYLYNAVKPHFKYYICMWSLAEDMKRKWGWRRGSECSLQVLKNLTKFSLFFLIVKFIF